MCILGLCSTVRELNFIEQGKWKLKQHYANFIYNWLASSSILYQHIKGQAKMEFFSISSIYALSVVCLGALLFFSVFAMIWIFWLMPVCKNNKLRKNGFRGPSPRFPFGNLMEMRNKALHQVPSPSSSSSSSSSGDHLRTISHDIHSIAFSYFAQWRKTFGTWFY